MFKKFLSVAIAASLLFSVGVSAHAADGDAYQSENAKVDPDNQVLAMISDKAGSDWTGLMRGGGPNPNHPDWTNCNSLTDPSCDFRSGDEYYQGTAIIEDCSVTRSDFCIESLELAAPGQDFQQANFVRETKQTVWTADREINFPGGGGQALFKAPNAPTAGGLETYAVQITFHLSWNPGMTKFDIHDMMASVLPYRGYANEAILGRPGQGGNTKDVCVWTEPGYCGVAQDWVPGTKTRLKFTMPTSITGWFMGRLKDPNISIAPKGASVNELTVSAEAVDVPQLAVVKPMAEKDALLNSGMDLGWGGGAGYIFVALQASSRDVAKFIERYRSELGDSSTGKTSMWNFSTINGSRGNNCLTSNDKVMGIVTTNAMGYDGTAPSFDNEMLTYHVSGMHYESDKTTLTEGTYDLVIRSDVARCLYGFTSAPISATVSVIDDKGQQKTAVTTVNEKDGWLKMAAYGFSFSNPTLNVKISQAKPKPQDSSSPTPSPKPSATNSPKATAATTKITITCVKGKTVKKVTAVSPKCPAGYKKNG